MVKPILQSFHPESKIYNIIYFYFSYVGSNPLIYFMHDFVVRLFVTEISSFVDTRSERTKDFHAPNFRGVRDSVEFANLS